MKKPVAWSYQIASKSALPEGFKNYSIHINTDLDPMSFWAEIDWRMQYPNIDRHEKERLLRLAKQDTINKWSDTHMAMPYPKYIRDSSPDFTITLTTDQFSVDNLNTDIDFGNQESLLGEINISANLLVKTSEGVELLNEDIRYFIDDANGPTTSLRWKHFIVNPSFKLKFKMTKKREKRKKLLTKRVKKFEADILQYFIVEAGRILKDNYQTQTLDAFSSLFGVKSKDCNALNDASDIAKTAINSLSAFSRKKRKTLNEVKPDLEYARDYFTDKLTRTTDPTIQNALNANLATILLLLGDTESAKFQIQNIPEIHELKTKTIWEGSFTYYLQGITDALALKEQYGNRVTIYEY
nr:hypothetical protein [uncultured Allomuricauda sp.]